MKFRKMWNNNILTVIGASKIAPNADHLLNKNIRPTIRKIMAIKGKRYPVLNKAVRKAVAAPLSCGCERNGKKLFTASKIRKSPKITCTILTIFLFLRLIRNVKLKGI